MNEYENENINQKAMQFVRETAREEAKIIEQERAKEAQQKEIEEQLKNLHALKEKHEKINQKLAASYEDLRDEGLAVKSILEKTSMPEITIDALKALIEDTPSSEINSFFKELSEDELKEIQKCDTSAKITKKVEKMMNAKKEVKKDNKPIDSKPIEIPEPLNVVNTPVSQQAPRNYSEPLDTQTRNRKYQGLWDKLG